VKNSKISSILKCINQDIIVPGITAIKFLFLSSKITILDVKGSWHFYICIGDENITVKSTRRERSSPDAFQVEWSLIITLNKDASENYR